MTTRRGRATEVLGSSGSKRHRASSPDCWARRPYTIPLTFAVADFKGNPETAAQIADVEKRGLGYLMGPHSVIYPRIAREFFKNLEKGYHGGTLTTTVDGRQLTFGPEHIARALETKFVVSEPFRDDIMNMHPSKLVQALHVGDSHGEVSIRRAHLHRSLWFIDYVLRNLCPQGHKDTRRQNFLRCLYSFHIGAPINVPWVMFREFERFKRDMKKETEIPFPHMVTKLVTLSDVDKQPPFRIPRGEERNDDVVTFVLDAWYQSVRGIENSLKNKPPVAIAALLLAQEPPLAGGVPHVPPPLTPPARGWRFTQAEYHKLQCDLADVRARQDFFQQSFTDFRLEQHRHAYEVRTLLHQLAHLPPTAPYEAPIYPQFSPPPRGVGAAK